MILRSKTAVITGCTRGIGKAIVEKFAENGCNIYAIVRNETAEFEKFREALCARYGTDIVALTADITDAEQLKNAMKSLYEKKARIDVLVNNAGVVGSNKSFLMTSLAEERAVFETNFFAQMAVTQYIVKLMIRNSGGSIVNISSVAGLDGDPAPLEYVASKAAFIGATKKLAKELAAYNIRVNSVAPGLTLTDMAQNMPSRLQKETAEAVAMKRLGHPEEIANAALFLASDLASYVNGQVLRVDGGI